MPPSAARLAFLAEEYREAVSTDSSVLTVHLLSPELVRNTTLIVEADAQAEADRIQVLHGVQRDVYEFETPMNASTNSIDLGTLLLLTHDRFGLAAGQKFVVLGVEPDASRSMLQLTVWG